MEIRFISLPITKLIERTNKHSLDSDISGDSTVSIWFSRNPYSAFHKHYPHIFFPTPLLEPLVLYYNTLSLHQVKVKPTTHQHQFQVQLPTHHTVMTSRSPFAASLLSHNHVVTNAAVISGDAVDAPSPVAALPW